MCCAVFGVGERFNLGCFLKLGTGPYELVCSVNLSLLVVCDDFRPKRKEAFYLL